MVIKDLVGTVDFSQGIRQPECEADGLPPAGADVSYPAPYICCTLQLLSQRQCTAAVHTITSDGFLQLPLLTANLPEGTSLWTGSNSVFY